MHRLWKVNALLKCWRPGRWETLWYVEHRASLFTTQSSYPFTLHLCISIRRSGRAHYRILGRISQIKWDKPSTYTLEPTLHKQNPLCHRLVSFLQSCLPSHISTPSRSYDMEDCCSQYGLARGGHHWLFPRCSHPPYHRL